jgi:hypothetical protein
MACQLTILGISEGLYSQPNIRLMDQKAHGNVEVVSRHVTLPLFGLVEVRYLYWGLDEA